MKIDIDESADSTPARDFTDLDRQSIAKSLFGILPCDITLEEATAERLEGASGSYREV